MPRRKKKSSAEREAIKEEQIIADFVEEVKEMKAAGINQAEISRLQALIEADDEEEIEKEIKKVLKDRKQKLHRQVADMESRNKRLLMWAGIAVVMLIVVSFWLVKFNEIVSRPITSTNQAVTEIDFDQAKEELTKTMDKVRQGIEEIKQEAASLEAGKETETPTSGNAAAQLPVSE